MWRNIHLCCRLPKQVVFHPEALKCQGWCALCVPCWKHNLISSIEKQHCFPLLAKMNITQRKIAPILFVLRPLVFLTALSVPSVLPHLSPSVLSLAPLRSWLCSLSFPLSLSVCISPSLPPFVHASVIAVVTLKPGRIAQGNMCRGEPSFNCRLFVMEIRSHSRNNG